jgi:hypothetical protein
MALPNANNSPFLRCYWKFKNLYIDIHDREVPHTDIQFKEAVYATVRLLAKIDVANSLGMLEYSDRTDNVS